MCKTASSKLSDTFSCKKLGDISSNCGVHLLDTCMSVCSAVAPQANAHHALWPRATGTAEHIVGGALAGAVHGTELAGLQLEMLWKESELVVAALRNAGSVP